MPLICLIAHLGVLKAKLSDPKELIGLVFLSFLSL